MCDLVLVLCVLRCSVAGVRGVLLCVFYVFYADVCDVLLCNGKASEVSASVLNK